MLVFRHYSLENFNLDNEKMVELNNIIQDAKTQIAIEISSEDGSSLLPRISVKTKAAICTLAFYNFLQ